MPNTVPTPIKSVPTGKPTITDEHIVRYNAIMKSPVVSKSPAPTGPPPLIKSTPNPSRVSALLSSIPTPKGIGNKMFVFTGKKKIIMEGSAREEEHIKTVDPAKVEKKAEEKKELEEKKEGKKRDAKTSTPPTPVIDPILANSKPVQIAHAPTVVISAKKEGVGKKAEETPTRPAAVNIVQGIKTEEKKAEKNSDGKKKIPTAVVVIAGLVFFAAWTLFWLVFFGYVKF